MDNEIVSVQNDLALNPNNATVIFGKIKNALEALSQLSREDKIMQYIRQGESLTVEFKETFETNNHTGKKDEKIRVSSLKNIVGFMNKKGGVLLIGVADDGEIKGVENDHFKNGDKYLLNFKNSVKERIGPELGDFIEYELISISGKSVLLVDCLQSTKPVYLDKKDFYVRTNPAVDKLEGPAVQAYIENHFNKK
jgi:predicted HTH transcriptional regulator